MLMRILLAKYNDGGVALIPHAFKFITSSFESGIYLFYKNDANDYIKKPFNDFSLVNVLSKM